MWDNTVPSFGLTMKTDSLPENAAFALPEGIEVRNYRPGDERIWAELWVSAGGMKTVEGGIKSFHRDFPDVEQAQKRVFFLTENGVPFATAAAWYSDDGPDAPEGRLHWVCIDEAHQGKGYSKVLIACALERLRALGHRSAYLLTVTHCWVAIRMYRRFGFRAFIAEEKDREGWRIVSEKTGIDFLTEN